VVTIGDLTFEIFLTDEEILQETASLGKQLSADYAGKDLVFIAVLNGAFMFASDLMKNVSIPAEISFVKVSSYTGLTNSEEIKELIGLNTNIQGKHVVLIEDIVDTGNTIDKLLVSLEKENPLSVKVCTLLYKPEAFKGINKPDYVGFSIPNAFVVGYGLDYNELGRNLNAIYQLKKEE
jgi:hypoxanthine phosphoribosyltransferase